MHVIEWPGLEDICNPLEICGGGISPDHRLYVCKLGSHLRGKGITIAGAMSSARIIETPEPKLSVKDQ